MKGGRETILCWLDRWIDPERISATHTPPPCPSFYGDSLETQLVIRYEWGGGMTVAGI